MVSSVRRSDVDGRTIICQGSNVRKDHHVHSIAGRPRKNEKSILMHDKLHSCLSHLKVKIEMTHILPECVRMLQSGASRLRWVNTNADCKNIPG